MTSIMRPALMGDPYGVDPVPLSPMPAERPMGLAGLLGGLPPFFGTMGYPAPNPYGNDPRRGGGRGMGDLRRKYKPYGDGDRNNPYQPGFPSFPPRDFGLAGNPYGGGPKTMAPVGTPLPSGYTGSEYTGPMPMQSDMMGMDQAYSDFLAQQSYAPGVMDNAAQNLNWGMAQGVNNPNAFNPSVGLGAAPATQMGMMGQSLMGQQQPAGSFDKIGMGGANPYTINQPATLATPMQQPMPIQQPVQQPMPQQRDPRQPQMQQPMQGGQMMNRPFAVRGR